MGGGMGYAWVVYMHNGPGTPQLPAKNLDRGLPERMQWVLGARDPGFWQANWGGPGPLCIYTTY